MPKRLLIPAEPLLLILELGLKRPHVQARAGNALGIGNILQLRFQLFSGGGEQMVALPQFAQALERRIAALGAEEV